ncbi:hypothetical protein FQ087_08705 [Sporosarcina sp. ANT_H38]|uniref:DUF6526 family protein n=1 Tax=Sporosarcina sp. ANT_H38 TaxID=2597358 RepID=UPI0011F123CA|nr:DUF6526 family protein [Sporosarcina sp. ANT_H38]KAA0966300.1 hypothetical protein FQ087_08705 [Sporosarcina sp. ANT_H38]
MKEQSVEKHTQYQPLQHYIWLPLSFVMLVSVFGYAIYELGNGRLTLQTILLLGLMVLAIISGILARMYALKLQDRLIRTEEQLRYYMLTTKRIDSGLTINQLIALRFAPDEEFVGLVDRAVAENLTPIEIKQSIQMWRADHQRV